MNEEWLIDGYNLLHAITSLKNSPHSWPSDRVGLCSLLAGFAASKKQNMQAVFDGVGAPAEMKVHSTRYFEAVYSQKVSADHYIEKYIYTHKSVKRFIVVTDDRTITDIAHGGGARVLKNSLFLEMLREAGKEDKASLDRQEIRSHGFNRPLDQKLKDMGL